MPAIGIFDSGLGGLIVLRALGQALPHESFIYLADTARVPYGSKSPAELRGYLSQSLRFLQDRNVKAFVVACNSLCSVMQTNSWAGRPVFGVIEPARLAIGLLFLGGTCST